MSEAKVTMMVANRQQAFIPPQEHDNVYLSVVAIWNTMFKPDHQLGATSCQPMSTKERMQDFNFVTE